MQDEDKELQAKILEAMKANGFKSHQDVPQFSEFNTKVFEGFCKLVIIGIETGAFAVTIVYSFVSPGCTNTPISTRNIFILSITNIH